MVALPQRRRLFPLGRVLATPGALDALARCGDAAEPLLSRHACGDWGEVCAEDARANERALSDGERLLSAYRTRRGVKLWIITEADRSSTCLLLPAEY
jgi:hypothetical protein